jgi:hypothetical protein
MKIDLINAWLKASKSGSHSHCINGTVQAYRDSKNRKGKQLLRWGAKVQMKEWYVLNTEYF